MPLSAATVPTVAAKPVVESALPGGQSLASLVPGSGIANHAAQSSSDALAAAPSEGAGAKTPNARLMLGTDDLLLLERSVWIPALSFLFPKPAHREVRASLIAHLSSQPCAI